MPAKGDPTALVGTAGFFATLSLAEINNVVSLLVGLATLGFVTTRWLLFVNSRGGFASILRPAKIRPEEPPQPPES